MAKFAHALDNFEPIDVQPSDTNLKRLQEAVTPLLLQIPYNKTRAVHNLIGLVRPEAAYVARYGEAFPDPTRVGPTILILTTTLQPPSLRDPRRPETARRETTQFVLAVVADTWVRELRDSDSLYTKVAPKELF